MKNNSFTEGAILPKLLKFMLPVLFAMFLQAMYGAVDLLVVGQFGTDADVSAVSTGSQIVLTITNLIVSFAMGITVAVAQRIGNGSLFLIGLATPCSTVLQIIMCFAAYVHFKKNIRGNQMPTVDKN